ncbi:MAG: hypothetical protein L6Q38_08225 [Nitrospira sp.]|nr:hypothetical protein [Nitrospira sp.]
MFVEFAVQPPPSISAFAATTTGTLVAQEITKLKPFVVGPKRSPKSRIVGTGRSQGAVGRPVKVATQPGVPGRYRTTTDGRVASHFAKAVGSDWGAAPLKLTDVSAAQSSRAA